MPVPLYTQTVIAFLWDFDRTLIPDNMQRPIFEEYGIDEPRFWQEVDGLVEFHAHHGEILSKDTAYLLHILSYVEDGVFELSGLERATFERFGVGAVFLDLRHPDYVSKSESFPLEFVDGGPVEFLLERRRAVAK